MKNWLFSTRPISKDIGIFILRVGAALMMLTHGWDKLSNYSAKLMTFSDPLGIGSALSLQLAIFAEFFCALLLAIGLMTRLSLVPLMITMLVAGFVAHAADPFPAKEKAFLFLVIFIVLFLLGPGKYSVDGQLNRPRRY
ncbi:DoxX family protein [Rhodonellum sp.]|uniref:DoxX family protein n=1 Tax=Rhodonellum sp. TaxID=2231180 RepID=UPI00271FA624|nr:DoxX family protein [Rhodonellum sp.]MDO9552732.1 DoxX family protein [Rhodonellum sp.]